MRTTKHCLTPLAAIAGGLLAGAVGPVGLDAVHYLKYRRTGGTKTPLAWEFAPVRTWEQASGPGQIARRVIEGFSQRKLSDRWAFPIGHMCPWGVARGVKCPVWCGLVGGWDRAAGCLRDLAA